MKQKNKYTITPLKQKCEDLIHQNIELRQENRILKAQIQKLELVNHTLTINRSTPMYKPRHTDYNDMSSPEMEELHDTVQIIRDSAYARELACTPEPLTIIEQLKRTKQILQDSILARKLSKYCVS